MNDRRIMASTSNAPLVNGRLIADRYQLLGLLGSGGMAEVWRARDEQLERDVAIKLLHAESGQLGEVSAAIDEARMAARLVHPNIVRVYDVGTDGGVDFVVMELVSGALLSQSPGRTGSLDGIVEIVAQLADALEHAHCAGVIHCDVKPQNVMLTDDGIPKLLDFGIAQRFSVAAQRNRAAEFLGSVPYVAPEQVRGEPIDGRADVYALGVVLFELLTGETPFKVDDPDESLRERLTSSPPSPRSLNAEIPSALESVVLQALATRASDRFQTAGAFRDALRNFRSLPALTEAPTQRYAIPVDESATTVRRSEPAERGRAPLPLLALALAGLLIAALVGLASAGAWPNRNASDTAPVESATESQTPAEPTVSLAAPEPTATPRPVPAVEPAAPIVPPPAPPRNDPPAGVSNPGPPPQPKQAQVQEDKKTEKEKEPPGQEKKAGDQAKEKRGRD